MCCCCMKTPMPMDGSDIARIEARCIEHCIRAKTLTAIIVPEAELIGGRKRAYLSLQQPDHHQTERQDGDDCADRSLVGQSASSCWSEFALNVKIPSTKCSYLDLHQSMRNGGGPACLRLRVPMNAAQLSAVKNECECICQ